MYSETGILHETGSSPAVMTTDMFDMQPTDYSRSPWQDQDMALSAWLNDASSQTQCSPLASLACGDLSGHAENQQAMLAHMDGSSSTVEPIHASSGSEVDAPVVACNPSSVSGSVLSQWPLFGMAAGESPAAHEPEPWSSVQDFHQHAGIWTPEVGHCADDRMLPTSGVSSASRDSSQDADMATFWQQSPQSDFGQVYQGDRIGAGEQPELPTQGKDDAELSDPCYAQLLLACLKEAPDHTLPLQSIYNWISRHTQKARDPDSRGWQNSVRHNLSMNAAFERVTHDPKSGGKAKGSLWRLTAQALERGVISTTRFRKDPRRKPARRGDTAATTAYPSRQQLSGAKGGQATRAATRRRERHAHTEQQAQLLRARPVLRLASNGPSQHPTDGGPTTAFLPDMLSSGAEYANTILDPLPHSTIPTHQDVASQPLGFREYAAVPAPARLPAEPLSFYAGLAAGPETELSSLFRSSAPTTPASAVFALGTVGTVASPYHAANSGASMGGNPSSFAYCSQAQYLPTHSPAAHEVGVQAMERETGSLAATAPPMPDDLLMHSGFSQGWMEMSPFNEFMP